MRFTNFSLLTSAAVLRLGLTAASPQHPLHAPPSAPAPAEHSSDDYYFHFDHPIRRVAVIGGGAAGLQAAATLIEDGFEVRLFERADQPGGNWYYQDEVAPSPSYPTKSIVNASYTPEIPGSIPSFHVYEDGEDGISNSERLREHHRPSAVFRNMTTIAPPFMMSLPGVSHPDGLSWAPNNIHMQRLVRQYASAHGINANDAEHSSSISYSTRVERIHKPSPSSHTWTVSLRRLLPIPFSSRVEGDVSKNKVRADWWEEEFDAIVVATGDFDAAFIPRIEGVERAAQVYGDAIMHSREYRRPDGFAGKKVLVVGASISALGIVNDLKRSVDVSVTVSIRQPTNGTGSPGRGFFRQRAPANISIIPEIAAFRVPESARVGNSLHSLNVELANGTVVSGFDSIIFATGFRRSNPFLADFHNSTIKGYDTPETKVAPLITDGTHVRSLHWTGHYIDDPTIGIMRLVAWSMNRYQAHAFSRTWAGKARLPSRELMWKTYPGPGKELRFFHGVEERYNRLMISWLNNEALEFGGEFLSMMPRYHQEMKAFSPEFPAQTHAGATTIEELLRFENAPRGEWNARNGPAHAHGAYETRSQSGSGSGSFVDGGVDFEEEEEGVIAWEVDW